MLKSRQQHIYNIFRKLHDLFKDHGHEIRLAGGAVRDILEGKTPSDLDFCTTMTPDEMMKMYKDPPEGWIVRPTGLQHGTVTFSDTTNPIKNGYEVTTLRKDTECDGRRAKVEFTDNWEVDAARRDFTFNAMSMDINGKIYDYFGGQDDLKNGVVRFVGDPDTRIEEDALRMMRALRFLARYAKEDMNVLAEENVIRAIKRNKHLIKNITVERIWNEYTKAVEYNDSFTLWYTYLIGSGLAEELGFPVTFSCGVNPMKFDKSQYPIMMPCLAVAARFQNSDIAKEFYKKYKLSRLERKQIDFFLYETADDGWSGIDFNRCADLLEEDYPREWIAAVCHYYSEHLYEKYIYHIEVPICPVTAQDLLDNFDQLQEGRKLGNIMRDVHLSWKRSRFYKDYNELIAEVSAILS